MPLGLTVTLLVLGGIVLAGVAGYLIDKTQEASDDLPPAPAHPHHQQEPRHSR